MGLDRPRVRRWFAGQVRRLTSAVAAKLPTRADGVLAGRAEGGLARGVTPTDASESDAMAEARPRRFPARGVGELGRFAPE
jgi:hypothetical protein